MILSDASFHTPKTCAKMQKEEQKRNDVLNGNRECGANHTADEGARGACAHGGRLKFFKDGKFILELERAREGERVSWVSVPRKTFWPPQGTASSTPSYRQESSTSLSDDNSSIQSSPWQRDHSWKQTTPRKHQSKELAFFYRRPRGYRPPKSKKRRRPHDPASPVAAAPATPDATPPCNTKKPSLLAIIQTLLEKQSGSPRSEQVVSPRKRFLREMEKDKVQMEAEGGKRSRGKPSGLVCGKVPASGLANGATEEPKPKNSYSITSLLADDRKPKKSPGHSPSHFSPPGAAVGQYPYPAATTSEERVFVDKLRSIELSQADKRLYTSYSAPYVQPFTYSYPHFYPSFTRAYPGMPLVYPIPIPVRPEAPSCSWAAEPSRDTEHRDENITDMPLNLSKHGA